MLASPPLGAAPRYSDPEKQLRVPPASEAGPVAFCGFLDECQVVLPSLNLVELFAGRGLHQHGL